MTIAIATTRRFLSDEIGVGLEAYASSASVTASAFAILAHIALRAVQHFI